MKEQKTEFYIGLLVWLLDLTVAYGMWFSNDPDANISHPITLANIALVASLYLLFLVGQLMSYGFLIKKSTRLTKISGLMLSSAAVFALTLFFFFGLVALLATLIIIQLIKYIDEKPAYVAAILVPARGSLLMRH